MTSVFSYMFNNLSGLNDDAVGITEQELQSQYHNNWMTTNHFKNEPVTGTPIKFATSQPNVFIQKGPSGSLRGSEVDVESNLFISTIQTNPKCKLNLQQRQYLTVPYLGRGPGKPLLESKLQQGSQLELKKSCKTITEKSWGREKTPLVDSLQETIQNPDNLIEGNAHHGWIRGGLPSRQLTIESSLRKEA
jgi:hypothetical protein